MHLILSFLSKKFLQIKCELIIEKKTGEKKDRKAFFFFSNNILLGRLSVWIKTTPLNRSHLTVCVLSLKKFDRKSLCLDSGG